MLLPQRAANGSVGVIAKWMRVGGCGSIGVPAAKYLMFRILGRRSTALLAVTQSNLRVVERLEQLCHPVRIHRIDMRRSHHHQVRFGGGNAKIQRTPKGEVLRLNVDNFHREARRYGYRGIL